MSTDFTLRSEEETSVGQYPFYAFDSVALEGLRRKSMLDSDKSSLRWPTSPESTGDEPSATVSRFLRQ